MAEGYANNTNLNSHAEETLTPNYFFTTRETKINTLEESLVRFGMSTLLRELDTSLEHVRRNKRSKEEHGQFLKSADKKLLKLSYILHPDQAMRRGESGRQIAEAQKLQTALNATRTVLTILTDAFLKCIDIDYKYEYFAKLEISLLLNENKINCQVSDVSLKMGKLSEIKRMHIVGEKCKFLTECRKCIRSYLDLNKNDFKKFRDSALHHLERCIEGYKNIAMECVPLYKEYGDENEALMRFGIQKVAEQSTRESIILCDLQSVAKLSLAGIFQVFSLYGPTDECEYSILPFVYYVNVLLMCSVILDKKFKFLQNYATITPYFEKEPVLFLKAYYLASNYNNKTQCSKEVELILMEKYPAVTKDNIMKEFYETLGKIDSFLAEEFEIDSYNDSKSSRERFDEKRFKLNRTMNEFQEAEKNLQEKISLCKKENREIWSEYYEITRRTAEEESLEDITQKPYELLKSCEENIKEHKRMLRNVSHGSFNKCHRVLKDYKEMEKKIRESMELSEKIREQLSELLSRDKI